LTKASNHPLRKYRLKKGMNLREFAELVSVDISTICKIELDGDYEPSVSLVKKIIAATSGKLKPSDFIKT
jgi:DNA-binding XRE family transcriptional regulator